MQSPRRGLRYGARNDCPTAPVCCHVTPANLALLTHGNRLQWRPLTQWPPGSPNPIADMFRSGRRAPAEEQLARELETFRPDLMRFAFWLARDRSVAEDVVQESLLRAWRSRYELHDSAARRSWLLTIVRREYARLHERKRLPTVDIQECVAGDDIGLAFADPDPEIEDLRRALLVLPDEYREPLVMQVLGGFTTAEIANELSLSVPAVLTRLFRARNKLRELLGAAADSTSAAGTS